jgi:hypothetical protein
MRLDLAFWFFMIVLAPLVLGLVGWAVEIVQGLASTPYESPAEDPASATFSTPIPGVGRLRWDDARTCRRSSQEPTRRARIDGSHATYHRR